MTVMTVMMVMIDEAGSEALGAVLRGWRTMVVRCAEAVVNSPLRLQLHRATCRQMDAVYTERTAHVR